MELLYSKCHAVFRIRPPRNCFLGAQELAVALLGAVVPEGYHRTLSDEDLRVPATAGKQ